MSIYTKLLRGKGPFNFKPEGLAQPLPGAKASELPTSLNIALYFPWGFRTRTPPEGQYSYSYSIEWTVEYEYEYHFIEYEYEIRTEMWVIQSPHGTGKESVEPSALN